MGIWKIAAECGLAVGASRHQPEVRAATVTALASDESRNRLAAPVLVGLRRHRQPGVIGEQRDQPWCITLLHGGDEAADEFALAHRARQRDNLAITDGEVVPLAKVRGNQKAMREFVERFTGSTDDVPELRVGIAHADAPERAQQLVKMVRDLRPRAEIELVSTLGAVVGTHAGPGCVGFFWFTDA